MKIKAWGLMHEGKPMTNLAVNGEEVFDVCVTSEKKARRIAREHSEAVDDECTPVEVTVIFPEKKKKYGAARSKKK